MSNLKVLIQNRPDKINYSQFEDEKSVCLGYFESNEYTSEKNTVINDLSWAAYNEALEEEEFFNLSKKEFETTYKEVLITDISIKTEGMRMPLFYKAKLNEKIANVTSLKRITNDSESNVNNGYKIVDGVLYTNFKNTFNNKTKRFEIYRFNGTLVTGESFTGLLNLINVYEEKTFENRDSEKLFFKMFSNGKYRYRLQLKDNQETLARLACGLTEGESPFYWKPVEESKLKIKNIEPKYSDEEWLVEISNGVQSVIKDGNYYRYSLPEYKYQTFSPYAPLKRLLNKECSKVSKRVIKLPYRSIVNDGKINIYLEYFLNGKKVIRDNVNVISVDEMEGFVEINTDIEDYYEIKADFTYICKSVILKTLNLNPYFNQEALNTKYIIGVLPNNNVASIVVFKCVENKLLAHELYEGSNSIEGLPLNEFYDNKTLLGNGDIYILGEVYFKDSSVLSKSMFFDKRKKEYIREEKLSEIFTANAKIQHTKYGYGEDGISYVKNNIRYLSVPKTYKENFEKDVSVVKGIDINTSFEQTIFERNISDNNLGETKLVFMYEGWDAKVNVSFNSDLEPILKVEWEGPGEYKVLKESSKEELLTISSAEEPFDRELVFENSSLKGQTVRLSYNDKLSEQSLELP